MLIRFCAALVAMMMITGLASADEIDANSILVIFDRGGLVMWAILAVSILGCAFVLERVITLRRSVQIPKRLMADLRDAMVKGGVSAGREVVAGGKSAMARVMSALLSRS